MDQHTQDLLDDAKRKVDAMPSRSWYGEAFLKLAAALVVFLAAIEICGGMT